MTLPVAAAPAPSLARLNLVFVLSIALLAVRVLLVPEAILMSDEYYYAKTVQLWFLDQEHMRRITSLPNRGEASFPNALYFFIYQIAYAFGDNFYVVAKLINVAFAALMALAVRRVAGFIVDARAALAIAVLVLWLPASTYYAYFMPEPLYEALVWWGIALFLGRVAHQRNTALALLGAFFGAALLAKPNAAAMLIAGNAVVLALAWRFPTAAGRLRDALVGLVVLNLAFVLAGYTLNVLLNGQWAWDPLGKFYQNGLSKLDEIGGGRSFAYLFGKYFAAYVFALLLVFGPALLAMAAGWRLHAKDVRTFAFWAVTVLGLGALLLGSVQVAVNWERVYVNHVGVYSTRYMSVLFPLLVIGFVHALPQAAGARSARRWLGLAAALAALGLAALFYTMSNTLQMREVYWPTLLRPILYLAGVGLGVATLLYFALAARPRAGVYAAVLALVGVGSSLVIARDDAIEATSGGAGRFAAIAKVTQAVVRPEWHDRGHVVTTDRRGSTRFMFRFPGIVPITVIERDRPLLPAAQMPQTPWTIYLGRAEPEVRDGCVLALPSALLCVKDPQALYPTR